jgi:hypothetical protein
MASVFAHSKSEVVQKLLNSLGLNDKLVKSITINFNAGEIVTANAVIFVPEDAIEGLAELNWILDDGV